VAANDAGSGRTARAALVLMSRDPAVRERVGPELERRYGADYEVVVCLGPDDVTSRVAELAARGVPVAVFLAGLSPADPDGLDVLAQTGALEPTAVRACIVRWGDLQTGSRAAAGGR
jgi:thioredoxin reductase (NADPH)